VNSYVEKGAPLFVIDDSELISELHSFDADARRVIAHELHLRLQAPLDQTIVTSGTGLCPSTFVRLLNAPERAGPLLSG